MSGTYTNSNLNVADAEYTSIDNWVTHQDGYDIDQWFLGEGFGDVQVNGSFVDWGGFQCVARLQPVHDAQWFREPGRLRR